MGFCFTRLKRGVVLLKFKFEVEVNAATVSQAMQVVHERLDFEDHLGFEYRIFWDLVEISGVKR